MYYKIKFTSLYSTLEQRIETTNCKSVTNVCEYQKLFSSKVLQDYAELKKNLQMYFGKMLIIMKILSAHTTRDKK